MTELVQRCRKLLQEHYGDQLAGVVLYGSEALEQARPESDIDLLVLLKGEIDSANELRIIIDILYPIQLESDRHISARPALLADYESGSIQLYRNIQAYGVAV